MPSRGRRHGYMFQPKVQDTRWREECSKVAADLYGQLKDAGSLHQPLRRIANSRHGVSRTGSARMRAMLVMEARRLGVTGTDPNGFRYDEGLADDAIDFVDWAFDNTKVVNGRAIARFATRAAFEKTQQRLLTSIISDELPRRWWSETVAGPRGQRRELRCDVADGTTPYALLGRKNLEAIAGATAGFVVGRAPRLNIHKPYLGVTARFGWALDPARPPMSSVRFVASLIEKYKGTGPNTLLAFEPGLTALVQGLALFLPDAIVHMHSSVLGDATVPVQRADVVVVNLANARAMGLLEAVARRSRPLDRDEIDLFWHLPVTEPGDHSGWLVQLGLRHLADDGLLVVLGDVDSGIHHEAVAHVANEIDLHEVKAAPTKNPVRFGYTKPPWAPLGGLPATDRFVSAWMRLSS